MTLAFRSTHRTLPDGRLVRVSSFEPSRAGRYVAYHCRETGHVTLALMVDDGVIPVSLPCRRQVGAKTICGASAMRMATLAGEPGSPSRSCSATPPMPSAPCGAAGT